MDENMLLECTHLLSTLYGPDAEFREGQYEAIEATMRSKRTLVVQKTGWGKSLVYFMCTKLLRARGKGTTLVVSPLLTLMENQSDAATALGLSCDCLNSTTRDRRGDILERAARDELDLIFVTPETLFNQDVQVGLASISIGLFVVDEAHCISDWGHDFRLDYGNLHRVIDNLPSSIPVLATTATANDRVVEDVRKQLGGDAAIIRGPLTRESLAIQVLPRQTRAERYAWILDTLDKLPSSGIIYCLTRRDCDYLCDFLEKNGVAARSYYSRGGDDEALNREAEALFQNNEIKVLVATIKLGMGYDKGDIGFVIHYQLPSNIVSYYQQIGRAGRNIPRAYAILMHGSEDDQITDYFIDTAFPSEREARAVISELRKQNGQSFGMLQAHVNMRRNRLVKALDFLVNERCVVKDKTLYRLTPNPFHYQREHYDKITAIRKSEHKRLVDLLSTASCYSEHIVKSLDDPDAHPCGTCANCLGHPLFPERCSPESLEKANKYIDGTVLTIEPRKIWAAQMDGTTKIEHQNEQGLCLSRYGEAGFGKLVKDGKYSGAGLFCDELVGKSASVLRPLVAKESIEALTCVPSLRSGIVMDFSKRLAANLGIPFVALLSKKPSQPQKEMENSSHQCQNALNSFGFVDTIESPGVPKRLLLVDDIVDSRWTLTVCGYLLMKNGCEKVYPFALADSSQGGD